jgi:hypothetical protein
MWGPHNEPRVSQRWLPARAGRLLRQQQRPFLNTLVTARPVTLPSPRSQLELLGGPPNRATASTPLTMPAACSWRNDDGTPVNFEYA